MPADQGIPCPETGQIWQSRGIKPANHIQPHTLPTPSYGVSPPTFIECGDLLRSKLGRDWVVLSLDYKRKRKPKTKKGGQQ